MDRSISKETSIMMKRTTQIIGVLVLLITTLVMSGCQGGISDKPPIHINPNMDSQEKFEAQEANPFFEDGRAMRLPVSGTVARGFLKDDVVYWTGRDEEGAFASNPLTVDQALLERGRERYDIYCSVCHGLAGDGKGILMTGNYGYVPAPSYHTGFLRRRPDGYFYDALTNGIRNMPGYGSQIPVGDRWAIVAYIRALQRSQRAPAVDVPESQQ